MNVYDFDGTIYSGDSSVDFYFYSLRRHPGIIRYAPGQAKGALLYFLKRIDKKSLKEHFFSFLRGIDAAQYAEDFWQKNAGKIRPWYLQQQAPDDAVISASPEFLLQPICRMLNIQHLIASKVQLSSGRFLAENCYGAEKLRRWNEESGHREIDCFYSDSQSDAPLASFAKNAFLLKNGAWVAWNPASDGR